MNRGLAFVTAPLLTAVVTVASAAGVLVGPSVAAIAGGILLGFVLPGLALTEILFRRRTLSPVERTVLAPGLSLATLIISGLLLYVGGIHLDRTSWTLAATGVTLVVLALSAVPQRVRQDDYDEPVAPGSPVPPGSPVAPGSPDSPPSPVAPGSPGSPGRSGSPEEEEPSEDRELVGAETVRIHLPGAGEAATEFIPVIRDGDAPPRKKTRALPGPFAPSAEHKVEVRQLLRQLLPMVMVVAVLAGAGYLSFVSSRASYDVTVTRLSAAPPGEVNAAGDRVVEVTASGLIADSGPYDLQVTDEAGTKVLERVITVDADGTWSAALTLPSADRLTVGLLRAADTTPYRTLLIAAALP